MPHSQEGWYLRKMCCHPIFHLQLVSHKSDIGGCNPEGILELQYYTKLRMIYYLKILNAAL